MPLTLRRLHAPILFGAFILACLIACAGSASAQSKSAAHEIIFQGKLYPSLRRDVVFPFAGEIVELRVLPGKPVKAGEVVLRYRLDQEVAAGLRAKLAPVTVIEIEARRAQVAAQASAARNRLSEITALEKQNMAAARTKSVSGEEVAAYDRQIAALSRQIEVKRELDQVDLAALRDKIGPEVRADHVPEIVSLKSPINGHVTWINPEVRPGAKVAGGMPSLVVGVLDPMLIRANIFEVEASLLHMGDHAQVTLGSIPGKTFEAVVSRTSLIPVTPGLDKPSYYEIELTAPNPELLLKEGFKTEVTFRKNK